MVCLPLQDPYVEEYEKAHSSKHPFLDESQSVDVPPGVHPLAAVQNELTKAKAEMQLVLQLLMSVYSTSTEMNDYKQVFRYTRHEESREDKQVTDRTQMANLASSYVLLEEASSFLTSSRAKIQKAITSWAPRDRLTLSQRNYFNDLSLYGKHFNVVTYHGDNLTFVKSSDSLLVNCSFNNSKDLTSCIPLFSGENGFIVFKSHDASFYSYLSLTITLIDDVVAYTASYDCHPSLDGPGLYADFLSQLRLQTASPYLESNISQYVLLQHSVVARDLFARLYDGCSHDCVSYFAIEVCTLADSQKARRQPVASGADAQLRDHAAPL